MSSYRNIKTKITDKECLQKALEEKGFHPEYHENGAPLVGFQGDYRTSDGVGHTTEASKAMHAEVILRRKEVGSASNDIGFKKTPSGSYEAIISQYDSSRYNEKWLNDLTDKYALQLVKKKAKQNGLRLISEKTMDDGSIKVVYEQVKA